MRTTANKPGDLRVKVLTFPADAHPPIEGHSVVDVRPGTEKNGARKRMACVFKLEQQVWCEVRVSGDRTPAQDAAAGSVGDK